MTLAKASSAIPAVSTLTTPGNTPSLNTGSRNSHVAIFRMRGLRQVAGPGGSGWSSPAVTTAGRALRSFTAMRCFPLGASSPSPPERHRRLLVARGRLGDGETRQSVAEPSPAIPHVTGNPGECGRQCVDVAGREDLTHAADEVGAAAYGVADNGDQPAGHALVDHQSPRLTDAWQGQDVPGGVPGRQLGLVDEAEAAHRQALLVFVQRLPERPVTEQQQVELDA